MSRSERNMVYIILGMLLSFIAIFIIIAYIPSGAFDWIFKGPSVIKSDEEVSGQGAGEGQPGADEAQPEKSRL